MRPSPTSTSLSWRNSIRPCASGWTSGTPPPRCYLGGRVKRALKGELRIEDGLAAENVYIIDPCCGTGACLTETLKRIADNLQGKGLGL